MFWYKVKNPLCLTDLERAYAVFNGQLFFFFFLRKDFLFLRGQTIPIDYSNI